jgi:hypothetical protein
MRWIFISLVVLNLAYLGYEFTQPQKVEQQQAVDVQVVSGAAPIHLLAEVDGVKKRNKQSVKQAGDGLCWAVGPYKVELDAKHLYARMTAIDIKARVKPQSVLVKEEFWVYLPPLPNKKQAVRKLKELQKRKVDSFVITEGELANGISLGLFSQQKSVDRLLAGLKKKKITPKVKNLKRTREQYWVVTPVNKQFSIDEKTKKRLLEGRKVEWQQIRCDSGLPQA